MDFPSNDSYFSLLNLSFVENCHISIFTTFAKQSMINRLSNSINRNRSAAKISKVMSSIKYPLDVKTLSSFLTLFVGSNMDYISFFQLWIVFVWGISVRRTKVSGNVVEDLPFTVIVASYFHSLAIVKNFHPCEQNQIANRSMITHGQLWYNHS